MKEVVSATPAGGNGSMTCVLCAPHTINGASPDDTGAGFRAKCMPCPDYTEAPGYGNTDCSNCPAGQVRGCSLFGQSLRQLKAHCLDCGRKRNAALPKSRAAPLAQSHGCH